MMTNIGAVLRKARKREGYSQEHMAHELHTSLSAVSKMENNHQRVDVETFIHWMRHTNAQDIAVATLLAVDPGQVAQILEGINQLGQFVGNILFAF